MLSTQADLNSRGKFSLSQEFIEFIYRKRASFRLDFFKLTPDNMVCIYDFKTGKEGLSAPRALELYTVAKQFHPFAQGFVLVQVRPET